MFPECDGVTHTAFVPKEQIVSKQAQEGILQHLWKTSGQNVLINDTVKTGYIMVVLPSTLT